MDTTPLIHANPHGDAVGERYRRVAPWSSAHPVVDVVARLLAWLALSLLTCVVWLYAALTTMTIGYTSEPPPEPGLTPLIAAPVLFVVSLASLVGPGAPRGLRAFGAAWGVLVSPIVVAATFELL